MRWPWVRRSLLDLARGRTKRLRARLRQAREREAAAEARAAALSEQLARSERERTDVAYKLMRVGYGINPFAEELVQPGVLPPEPPATNPDPGIRPGSTAEEVQATFVRQGMEMFGGDLRKVARFVEKKQAEYYAHRERPAIVSREELSAAAAVAADLTAALEEGAAAAAAAKE